MDRFLKQGRDYVEDVINQVRTCLWPDPAKHPNNMPRDAPSASKPETTPSQPRVADPETNEDELMSEAPTVTAS
jgi:hypothetical protein